MTQAVSIKGKETKRNQEVSVSSSCLLAISFLFPCRLQDHAAIKIKCVPVLCAVFLYFPVLLTCSSPVTRHNRAFIKEHKQMCSYYEQLIASLSVH